MHLRIRLGLKVLAAVFMIAIGVPVVLSGAGVATKVLCLAGLSCLAWFIGWVHPDRFSAFKGVRDR